MNAAKTTLTSTVLAAALGLALGLSAVPAAQANPADQDGCHDHKPCQGGGRSDDASATSGFDNLDDEILSDCNKGDVVGGVKDDPGGNQCYVDGEDRVKSKLGGPNPSRFEFTSRTSKGGRAGREITLDLSGCDPAAEPNVSGCGRLADLIGADILNEAVTTDGFAVSVRPYANDCPEDAIPEEGSCGDLNVFTMAPADPVPMGLWIWLGEFQIQIEFASGIDTTSSIQPGKCEEACVDEGVAPGFLADLADVMVTASEDSAFGLPLDQNNSWTVEAAEIPALVCRTGPAQECIAKINNMSLFMRIERAE